MNARPLAIALAVLSAAAVAQTTPAPVEPAASAAPAAPAKAIRPAGDACEDAVAETVRKMRGRAAAEVQFSRDRRVVAAMSDDETSVKGAGRYRGAGASVPFTYTCAYNTKTGETTGALVRDAGATATAAAAPEAAWQPDLTRLSPEDCETATVAVLKGKYPRVGRIAFGSDSRQLSPAGDGRTRLEGQGGVERAPGMHSIPFRYRCDYDTRSGKVLTAQTLE